MRRLLLSLLCLFLSACGMKGDLYEPKPPATDTAESPAAEPAAEDPGEGARRTIPAAPVPAQSQ